MCPESSPPGPIPHFTAGETGTQQGVVKTIELTGLIVNPGLDVTHWVALLEFFSLSAPRHPRLLVGLHTPCSHLCTSIHTL